MNEPGRFRSRRGCNNFADIANARLLDSLEKYQRVQNQFKKKKKKNLADSSDVTITNESRIRSREINTPRGCLPLGPGGEAEVCPSRSSAGGGTVFDLQVKKEAEMKYDLKIYHINRIIYCFFGVFLTFLSIF